MTHLKASKLQMSKKRFTIFPGRSSLQPSVHPFQTTQNTHPKRHTEEASETGTGLRAALARLEDLLLLSLPSEAELHEAVEALEGRRAVERGEERAAGGVAW